jgi:hypothetical protein
MITVAYVGGPKDGFIVAAPDAGSIPRSYIKVPSQSSDKYLGRRELLYDWDGEQKMIFKGYGEVEI